MRYEAMMCGGIPSDAIRRSVMWCDVMSREVMSRDVVWRCAVWCDLLRCACVVRCDMTRYILCS